MFVAVEQLSKSAEGQLTLVELKKLGPDHPGDNTFRVHLSPQFTAVWIDMYMAGSKANSQDPALTELHALNALKSRRPPSASLTAGPRWFSKMGLRRAWNTGNNNDFCQSFVKPGSSCPQVL